MTFSEFERVVNHCPPFYELLDVFEDGKILSFCFVNLHQNKFSACKSADDCKQFFLCLLWLFRKDLQKSLPQTENL